MPPELFLSAGLAGAVAAACLVLSWIFREYSWTDRIWSVVPAVYVGSFAWAAGGQDLRLDAMTAMAALWGARLTFNFWRKGGYAPGGEDYRWAVLRTRMPAWAWHAFNVAFIAGYQNLLLLLIALPAWQASRLSTPFGAPDVVMIVLWLALLAGETLADQQQWEFHLAKAARRAGGEREPLGFVTTGLWAWSRHPNYFFEISQWWVLYAWAVLAGAPLLNPSIAGAVLLTLLFDGSARFTEWITAGKYPAYADYQRRVSRILPWPPRPAPVPT
jgi:steroid 5-alpha reductase family enzyme